jgi:hypothetical protein
MAEGNGNSSTKETNVFGTLKNLGASSMEAAYNEKVYLFLRALLNQKNSFDEKEDKEIKEECNTLYTTWENYLDNAQGYKLPQLKEAYLKCKPLVEKKFRKLVVKKVEQGKKRALELKKEAIKTKRKIEEKIMQQSKAFAKNASEQYKNMSEFLPKLAKNIAEQTKHLSGVAKEEAIKRLTQTKTEGLSGPEKQHMEDMFRKLVSNINKNPSPDNGGARLTRKRKRKRKKRKTRRHRK